ncbi:LPS translocon maturation chaperone LptM [Luteimonas sp. e5]
MNILRPAALCVLVLALVACGNKGPLRLPQKPQPVDLPAPPDSTGFDEADPPATDLDEAVPPEESEPVGDEPVDGDPATPTVRDDDPPAAT